MKRTALILEDEALIAIDLESALEKAGFEVVTLISCSDANTWLENYHPAVAIVDVQLRDGNCREAVEKLHRRGTPFIVHSGEYEGDFSGTVFTEGIWLGKPSQTGDLVGAAMHLLSEATPG